jgi:hypothetical protein
MEWAIFFTVISLYGIRFLTFAAEFLKEPEPQGPFQRPTVTLGQQLQGREELIGRLRGETSMNDMTAHQLERFVAALRENNEYNEARKRGLIPEKVNWKEEGF